jgi:hypothetical protein
MSVRKFKKDGTALTDKQIKNVPVLFGNYPFDADKNISFGKSFRIRTTNYMVLIKNKLKKETFDMSDAYVCGLAYFNKK